MNKKACTNCHFITKENVCPKCRSTSLSEDFSGIVIMFDPENSAIAKAMKIKEKGRYALKVRWGLTRTLTMLDTMGTVMVRTVPVQGWKEMAITYSVTPELRAKLKEPFGMLIRGSFAETMRKLETIVKREKPPKIISVGDTVSRNLHEHQMNPQLSITDNKRMRRRIKTRTFTGKNVVHVKNPRGTITEEAITAIRETLESDERVHIIVDGEEDLLALIAVLYAPEKSLVVYGQPYEGIVVVKVTSEKKAGAMEILNAMKTVRKAK